MEASEKKKTEKRALVSRFVYLILLVFALAVGVIYIISLNNSLGWFAHRDEATAAALQATAAGPDYEILVERATEYDSVLQGEPKYEGVSELKTELTTNYGYNITASSTLGNLSLAYELESEFLYEEDGVYYRYLIPGAYGTMTFYLRPASAGDVVANLQISLGCFAKDTSGGSLAVTEVTDNTVLDFLKGHILFFTGRTGATRETMQYSGLLEDGLFTYDTSQHSLCTEPGKTDCYKITLYWEWPATYGDIVDHITPQGGAADRYPNALADYMDTNRQYFFAAYQNSNDYDELTDGYNDGDQIIGTRANYIVATVSVL